ncbi:MAG: hypothetical protein Q8R47_03020 [Nanoarchaeota archaeon]|nr:hypothetical protein [Nanoarchaeota archaeon]
MMNKHAKHSKAKSNQRRPSKKAKNGSTLKAAELLREVLNLIAVYKREAKRDVTTRIDPDTADELAEKLGQLAKAL